MDVRVLDDRDGSPVSGAEVEVSVVTPGPPVRSFEATTVTDSSGLASLPVPAGDVGRLLVSAPGFRWGGAGPGSTTDRPITFEDPAILEDALTPGETRVVVVRLRRGTSVVGRVVFADGSPARGAVVRSHDGTQGPDATTDRDGRFRLENVVEGAGVNSHGESYVDATLAGVGKGKASLRKGFSAEPVFDAGTIALEPESIVRGRIVDERGRPIEGATVDSDFMRRIGFGGLAGRTGADGRFELSSGGTSFVASAEGRRAREVSLRGPARAGQVRTIPDVVLEPAPSVRVRVLDESGRPVSGVTVRRGDAAAPPSTTDASGLANAGAVADLTILALERPDRVSFSWSLEPSTDVVDVHLPATVPMTGRVVDEEGRPVVGARVTVNGPFSRRSMDPRRFATVETRDVTSDADGRFRLPAVDATGGGVRVVARGHVSSWPSLGDPSAPVEVTLRRIGDRERRRLREIVAEVAALEAQLRRSTGVEEDDLREKIHELQAEAFRLRGE
jgi:protocatechuate 3,4-dioxygenase beta subunit